MANSFVNLPVPGAVGVGAAADVSALGALKTLIVGGAFNAGVVIEASHDGVNFAQVRTISGPGAHPLPVVATHLRVRVTNIGSNGGVPTRIDVGAETRVVAAAELDLPAGDGAGDALDASALGPVQSFIVCAAGAWRGQVAIEASGDGVNWAPYVKTRSAPDVLTREGATAYLRAVCSGGASNIDGLVLGIVAEDPAA